MSFHKYGPGVVSLVVLTLAVAVSVEGKAGFDSILPVDTKAMLSIPDTASLREHWEATQLAEMMRQPEMKAFSEDLSRQIREKLTSSGESLGITWEDLEGVPSGELCIASVPGKKEPLATVILLDVTDHIPEASEFLGKIEASLIKRGAKQRSGKVGDVNVAIFDLPEKDGKSGRQAVFFVVNNVLCASEELPIAEDLIGYLKEQPDTALSSFLPYQQVMRRVSSKIETPPQVRWFVDPFGYATLARKMRPLPPEREHDMLKLLKNQGFTAVEAMGGFVWFTTASHEMLHLTSIYAPGDGNSPERFRLAARMLAFPKSEQLEVPAWVPHYVASATVFNWRIGQAFDAVGTFVDELYESPGLFAETLDAIKDDVDSPHVDIRQDLVGSLAERCVMIIDKPPKNVTEAAVEEGERVIFAIKVIDSKTLSTAIDEMEKTDPNASIHMVENVKVWEIRPDDLDAEDLEIDLPGVKKNDKNGVNGRTDVPLSPSTGIAVGHGFLFLSSHFDFLQRVLQEYGKIDPLTKSEDYRHALEVFKEFNGEGASMHIFTRRDEVNRPTYELIRQGLMPRSRTVMGRIINGLFGNVDEKQVRPAEIDGSKLPDYDQVRPYLGPAGVSMREVDDGWIVIGFIETKASPKP